MLQAEAQGAAPNERLIAQMREILSARDERSNLVGRSKIVQ